MYMCCVSKRHPHNRPGLTIYDIDRNAKCHRPRSFGRLLLEKNKQNERAKCNQLKKSGAKFPKRHYRKSHQFHIRELHSAYWPK